MIAILILIAIALILLGLSAYHRNNPQQAIARKAWLRTAGFLLAAACLAAFFHFR